MKLKPREPAGEARKGRGLTLANKITLTRILLIPVFVILLLHRAYGSAVGIGAVMMASDALDGLVARRFKQRTQLGSFLDPLADKLMLVSTYVALIRVGDMPDWILVVLLSKDVLVSLGWVLSYVLLDSSEVLTLFSGKAATASQMAFAGVTVLVRAAGWQGPISTLAVSFFQSLMVALTGLSLLDYLRLGSRRLARI